LVIDNSPSAHTGSLNHPFTQLRAKLAINRQPVFQHRSQYSHPRGWNDALDFVERCLKEIEGQEHPAP
jgi:hypothetical protein